MITIVRKGHTQNQSYISYAYEENGNIVAAIDESGSLLTLDDYNRKFYINDDGSLSPMYPNQNYTYL